MDYNTHLANISSAGQGLCNIWIIDLSKIQQDVEVIFYRKAVTRECAHLRGYGEGSSRSVKATLFEVASQILKFKINSSF